MLFAFPAHMVDCAGFILDLISFRDEKKKAKNENKKNVHLHRVGICRFNNSLYQKKKQSCNFVIELVLAFLKCQFSLPLSE